MRHFLIMCHSSTILLVSLFGATKLLFFLAMRTFCRTNTHIHNFPLPCPPVDAAYEGTMKRTFLSMSIMLGIQLVILAAFILLYVRLRTVSPHLRGREEQERVEEVQEEDESESEETELTQMVPKKDDI